MTDKKDMKSMHSEVDRLLPWFVNGSLASDESEKVDLHLAECGACRQQIRQLERMSDEIRSQPELDVLPGRAPVSLMTRIDAYEADQARETKPVRELLRWIRQMRHGLRSASPGMRRLITAQAIAISLLVVVVAWQGSIDDAASYRTLSNVESAGRESGTILRVVFDPALTQQDLQAILKEVDAQIVDGPSPYGVLSIVVEGDGQSRAGDSAIRFLREQGSVVFVEQVTKQGP